MTPSSQPKRLFTPGPLTTSLTVKQAMLHDPGSRDPEFIALVRDIREKLLRLANLSQAEGYEAIPIQGSGTFGVEAVLSSVIPRSRKLLVLVNGAYGDRMVTIAQRHGIPTAVLRWREDQLPDLAQIDQGLREDAAITHVAAVHCETTSGILNPAAEIGALVHGHGRSFLLDAMSSFGAVPLDLRAARVDFLISSANKCIEGVPGFSFVLARREPLEQSKGLARTLSLDLWGQWQGLEMSGQFRFTPPTQVLLAFNQALRELDAEGGPAGRAERYRANHDILVQGMETMGFRAYLPPQLRSYIITTFHYPTAPAFQFETFYRLLAEQGFLIYPGKLTQVDCFRIGTIGQLHSQDLMDLLEAIRRALGEMRLAVPLE